uniref:Regulator of ribonuclease activity A n=1 Tax=Solanum tuberosum TaxID=4113 RepID=M1DKK0_SOLTU
MQGICQMAIYEFCHQSSKIYGQRRAFSGPITTLKVFDGNVLVRELLETRGEGRVLVIDGGGSMRCALLGGNLGQLAQNMGWAGIVVNGCIRDVDRRSTSFKYTTWILAICGFLPFEIRFEPEGCDIGVRALASHPQKPNKKCQSEKHVPIYIGGMMIREGEWLYADSDGILVSKTELSI